MRCSGCGKEIPFAGQVCPYCQRDKSHDQQAHAVATGVTLACMALGYLYGGFVWMLVGGGIGIVLAVGLTVKAASAAQSQPPQVRVQDTTLPPALTPAGKTVQQRLAELDILRKDGLNTEAEYSAKRQAILDDL